MKFSRIVVLSVLAVTAFSFASAQAMDHPKKTGLPGKVELPGKIETPALGGDLLAVASKAGNLTTFLTAVKAAGLTDKLMGQGPFTIFAPTDEAFAALPDGVLDDLLKPANQAQLAGLLGNHVVPGKLMAADVRTMKAANVSGQDLDIAVHDGGAVSVNGARVVQADLEASNGVIHAVDQVILPAESAAPTAKDAPKDHPAH